MASMRVLCFLLGALGAYQLVTKTGQFEGALRPKRYRLLHLADAERRMKNCRQATENDEKGGASAQNGR